MKNTFDFNFKNPFDSPMLRKLFRPKANVYWDNIEKNTPSTKSFSGPTMFATG
jgi:hypothetical protein